MKKIIFTIDSRINLHKLWKNFLLYPPEGFKYLDCNGNSFKFEPNSMIKQKSIKEKVILFLYNIKNESSFLIHIYKFFFEHLQSKQIDKLNPDLVYCVNGRLYRGKNPWVVDFENPAVFFGYNLRTFVRYKNKIEKIFMQDNCKAIIAYSNGGKRGFLKNFKSEKIKHKVQVIQNVVFPLKNIKKVKHSGFNILFTGTSNLEDDFYSRGGREVVYVFLELSKKYPDIKLRIRCKVPEKEKRLLKNKNVEIYEDILSKDEFDALFLKSDLYLFPAYVGYALSVLEAMSFGLPIVTSDLLENGEPIVNGINGFKVSPPPIKCPLPSLPYYFFQKRPTFKMDREYVNRLVKEVEYLYHKPLLANKISQNNINKIKERYALQTKNLLLKDLYLNSTKELK